MSDTLSAMTIQMQNLGRIRPLIQISARYSDICSLNAGNMYVTFKTVTVVQLMLLPTDRCVVSLGGGGGGNKKVIRLLLLNRGSINRALDPKSDNRLHICIRFPKIVHIETYQGWTHLFLRLVQSDQ